MKKSRISILIIIILLLTSSLSVMANDEYPESEITQVIPFAPGGGSDTIARVVERYFEDEFGVAMDFTYQEGAGGAVGVENASRMAADGYNILTFNFPHMPIQPLAGVGNYSIEDFDFIGQLSADPLLFVVSENSPFDSIEDFVNEALENPGSLLFSSVDVMGGGHIAMLNFITEAGIEVETLPYDSGAEQQSAIMGGHVDGGIITKSTILGEIEAGTVKALGITTEERIDSMPDLPTLIEQGYDVVGHLGRIWMTPKGVPEERLERLRNGFKNIYDIEEFRVALLNVGAEPNWMHGEELEQFLLDYREVAESMLMDFDLLN